MTATPAERSRSYEVDHQCEFAWGRLTVSAGAAALFDLRPAATEGPASDLLVAAPVPAIAHPPLDVLVATANDIGEPAVVDGLMTGVAGGSDDDEWSFRLWSDAPPFDGSPHTGRLVAHNLAATIGDMVAGNLPHLLRQEGMPPVGLAVAEQYAVTLGATVRHDVHAVYCVEQHSWPPLIPGAA